MAALKSFATIFVICAVMHGAAAEARVWAGKQ